MSVDDRPWSQCIARRLAQVAGPARAQWQASAPIRHCVIDTLFEPEWASELGACFPPAARMHLRRDFRERKYVSAQMDRHDPRLEAALFAFHAPAVVQAVRDIVGRPDLEPDPELYAGGLSRMERGHFLNPHIDNSHDGGRRRWRSLNLLYYVPAGSGQAPGTGGELELWPQGVRGEPRRLQAIGNRLIIMETHQHAWHSVREVGDGPARGCISNYYFAQSPTRADQGFHVTSFRGRPEQPLRDLASRADSALRMLVRRGFWLGLVRSPHRYRR